MFNSKRNRVKTPLDEAIDDVLEQMKTMTADSKEYANMVKQLSKLHKLKEDERPQRVSRDTLASIAGSLLGIGVIVGYEQKHIFNSKALPFIGKFR